MKKLDKYQAYAYIDGLPFFLPGKEVYFPTFVKKSADVILKALHGIDLGRGIKVKEIESAAYIDDEVLWLWINNEISFELRFIAEVTDEGANCNSSTSK